MSAHGAPTLPVHHLAAHRQVAIIAASWHDEIMTSLIAGAQRIAEAAGVTATLIRVPGSFELPLVTQQAAATFDAVVALGVVIRGGTPHFDYVCQAATLGLSRVALDTATPVGFGLLTCDDDEQARVRAGLDGSQDNKGEEAMTAALLSLDALAQCTAAESENIRL